jgi:hypothetical protein
MAEDLSARVNNFAIYLPAIQFESASRLADTSKPLRTSGMPYGLQASDFDWLDQENKHWRYKWCLASAGHFSGKERENTITNRHEDTVVVGDSGGYQIATGALSEAKDWAQHRHDTKLIMQLWEDSQARHMIKDWMETHCDYAMTLDMPLWVQGKKNEKTPFHYLTEEQLTELTVSNLQLIDGHRNREFGCKYLNVLQAFTKDGKQQTSIESEDRWFDAVKQFTFEGWSLGGDVGERGGLSRVLRRLLILRDNKLLESPYEWCHVLGVSTPLWAVCFTAIQRAIRTYVNPAFTLSFDSASPYLVAGRYNKYVLAPRFGTDISNWIFTNEALPTGYGYANSGMRETLLEASPIAKQFTIQDLNPRREALDIKTTDQLSDAVLVNHNVYIYVKGMIEANEAAIIRQQAPADLLEAVSVIDQLFAAKDWQQLLNAHWANLDLVVSGYEAEFER